MYFELLRPFSVMFLSYHILPVVSSVFCFVLALGLYSCCWSPSDFQQLEHVRILYIHVPAAWMSLVLYVLVTLTSLLYLITKHPLFHLITQTGCQIGALFTLLTLVSGCLWGKPMWGTFWAWDARNTSVLILLFIYLTAMRLQSAEIGSIFVCLGFLNIPIIKFSVNWWTTLHQPSSITQFGTSIHASMLIPILIICICFACFVCIVFIIQTRRIILDHGSIKLTRLYTT